MKSIKGTCSSNHKKCLADTPHRKRVGRVSPCVGWIPSPLATHIPAMYIRHLPNCGTAEEPLAGCTWESTQHEWQVCTCGLSGIMRVKEQVPITKKGQTCLTKQ